MKVLSVGQCGFDDSRLADMVRKELGGTMERASFSDDALRKISETRYDLVLVNRIFDAGGENGVDFIRKARETGNATPIMLVSNYQDAQDSAVEAGALPGFGKGALGSPGLGELLRTVLGVKA